MSKFGVIGSNALIGIALALSAGPALSQQASQQSPQQATPGAPGAGLMQQVQQKQAEIQQLNQQLAQIQQATIEANPGLADQRDELLANVDEKMVEAGHDPDASRERIGELQEQLQGGELSTDESQSVTQEIRQEQTQLQQAARELGGKAAGDTSVVGATKAAAADTYAKLSTKAASEDTKHV